MAKEEHVVMTNPEADRGDGRARLTLDLSARQTAFLNGYCEREGVTKAYALRKACELLFFMEDARSRGLTPGAWKAGVDVEFVI